MTRAFFLCLLAAGGLSACGGSAESEPVSDPPDVLPGEVGVLAGRGIKGSDAVDGDDDGQPDVIPAMAATFDSPLDTTPSGDVVYIIDWNGHKVRRFQSNEVHFTTGTGVEGDACRTELEGGGCEALSAELNHPTDVVVDDTGRLTIAAWHNSKIKLCDPSIDRVYDECGAGDRKYLGDGGPCRDDSGVDHVSFDLPSSVVFDADGGLLISDQANMVIRRLGPDGVINAIAGHCPTQGGTGCPQGRGYSGDGGPATLASLANNLGQGTDPQGKIAIDAEGNLYIADTGNHAIRKVVPGSDGIFGEGDPAEEIITTIAGNGTPGHDGDGGPAVDATLQSPTDVAVAPDGSIYIADRANSCIRKIDPDGIITTAMGLCGESGPWDELVDVADARLRQPYGVSVDDAGKYLYVADTLNHVIRRMLIDE